MGVNSKLKAEIKACLRLAVPLAGAQLSQAANGFIDTIMMGLLGSQPLAAGGLGAVAFFAPLLITSGIVSAVSPLVAEAYGAGKTSKISLVVGHGLWLAGFFAFPFSVLLWNFGSLMPYLGQDASNSALAATYLQAIVWGFLPALAFFVLENAVAALSQPRPIVTIMICGTLFNAVANYVLMFGKLGFPVLGLAGIGWASAVAYWLMLIALVSYIFWERRLSSYKLFGRLLQLNKQMFLELIQIGLPVGVLAAVENGLFTITTFLMGYLGTTTLAAHQIVLRTSAIAFMVPLGIAYATTVRVGQLRGQGNGGTARLAGYVGMSLGGLFMAVMGLLFWVAPKAIIALYIDINNPDNTAVINTAIALLGVAALFQMFDGVQVIAAGALRGLKDTRIPMVIGIFAYWCVGLTSGYLLAFKLGFDGVGLWLGLAIGLALASIILAWRFHSLTALQPQANAG